MNTRGRGPEDGIPRKKRSYHDESSSYILYVGLKKYVAWVLLLISIFIIVQINNEAAQLRRFIDANREELRFLIANRDIINDQNKISDLESRIDNLKEEIESLKNRKNRLLKVDPSLEAVKQHFDALIEEYSDLTPRDFNKLLESEIGLSIVDLSMYYSLELKQN